MGESSTAKGKDDKQPPASFGIKKAATPLSVAPDGTEGYVNQVVAINKKPVAQGAFLQMTADDKRSYMMRYPGIRYRDLVPAFGGVYIVTGVSDVGEEPYISFGRLPLEGIEIPADARVSEGSVYTFVFGVGGGGELHGTEFTVDYVPRTTEKSERVKVQLRGTAADDTPESKMPRLQVAAVGDEVRIGKTMHKIVNIVSPDEETHVLGWVELAKEVKTVTPVK